MAFLNRAALESWLPGMPVHLDARKAFPPPADVSSSVRILRLHGGDRAFVKVNSGAHPFLCLNEWTASCLALLAGFDALPVAQVRWRGRISVGWPLIGPADRVLGDVGLSNPGYRRCPNSDRLPYQAATLDAWLVNPDRSASNVLAVPAEFAYLIDHDRACFDKAQYRGLEGLGELTRNPEDGWTPGGTAWTVHEASWRHGVSTVAALEATIAKCQAIPREVIERALAMAPAEWASEQDLAYLLEFILVRQRELPRIIRRWKQTFDQLPEWN